VVDDSSPTAIKARSCDSRLSPLPLAHERNATGVCAKGERLSEIVIGVRGE